MNFLQSKEWEVFQNSIGRKTFRINGKLIIKLLLPLGLSYFYSPRPNFKEQKEFEIFIKESEKIAKTERAIFFRVEPDINSSIKQFNNITIKQCKAIQPQDTLVLDLKHSEETLLKNMHPKTRYNIRIAERHEVIVKKTSDPKSADIFYNLALKTSKRDNFSYHPRAYYKQMLKILSEKKMAELLVAYKDDIAAAAILVMFYHKQAIYLHGASDWEYRNLMSPYLLQWDAIKEAKKRGCETYDFWGIAPEGIENHPWSGITRFKKGFAPNCNTIHYPDCLEIPFNYFYYNIYKLIKS